MSRWSVQGMGRPLLVAVLFLAVWQQTQSRPFDIDEYLYGEPQRSSNVISKRSQDLLAGDVNKVLQLLGTLRSLHHRRFQSSDAISDNNNDVIMGTSDLTQDPVRMRKRQRQCYWNIVTCY